MRMTFFALTLLAVGCAGTSKAKLPPQAESSPTPVARPMPSFSHRMINNHLRDGQEVVGKTDVKGALVR